MNSTAKQTREPLWLLTYCPHGDHKVPKMHKRYRILGHEGRPDGEPIPTPLETENDEEFWMPAREHLEDDLNQYAKKIGGKWL